MHMTTEEIDKKLSVLRDRWKKEANNRPIIRAQAGLLQLALQTRLRKNGGEQQAIQ